MASRVYPYLQSTRSRGFTLTPQQRAVGQVPWVQSPFFFSQYPRRFSMPKKQGSIRMRIEPCFLGIENLLGYWEKKKGDCTHGTCPTARCCGVRVNPRLLVDCK